MRTGLLNRRITLQQPVVALTAINEPYNTWATVATVWGAVEPATGTWYYAGRQGEAKVDGQVRIRYRADVQPTWRILLGDRILTIMSLINRNDANKELVIMYLEALD